MDSGSSSTDAPPPLQRVGSDASSLTAVDPLPAHKLPSSQYKGVVPQPNGRWGAQIYEKHRRVWLGTFAHEHDAGRAYDVAAQRFRGREAQTNFPRLPTGDRELGFLLSRSKSEVVDMLRKHTYADELRHSRRREAAPSVEREHLFDKALTPSDVGKLNRLVVPKNHAEKCFPIPPAEGGMLLGFEDERSKVWRFRFSYWNSSQSYVLTKGWSRFVKEKGLRAGDVVGFYCSKAMERRLYIECRTHGQGPVRMQVLRLFGVDIAARAPPVVVVVNENGKREREEVVFG
ncbi:hypothetical protein HPP92_024374 [Vanilla planifolia]|uniref:Uncharacterized protein n=1 Tax=Vanilla planifolia TaxID=51239 RepID=A0A835PQL7_VANPL|nr:hypothetical protein HPP92_024374 [Vanilla planifolia]